MFNVHSLTISFYFICRYNSKLTLLALPSVIYEPRFRGSIRNLVYSDQPNVPPRRQEMRLPRDIKVRTTIFFVDKITMIQHKINKILNILILST